MLSRLIVALRGSGAVLHQQIGYTTPFAKSKIVIPWLVLLTAFCGY